MACRNLLLVVLKMRIGIEAFYIDDRSQASARRLLTTITDIVVRMRRKHVAHVGRSIGVVRKLQCLRRLWASSLKQFEARSSPLIFSTIPTDSLSYESDSLAQMLRSRRFSCVTTNGQTYDTGKTCSIGYICIAD